MQIGIQRYLVNAQTSLAIFRIEATQFHIQRRRPFGLISREIDDSRVSLSHLGEFDRRAVYIGQFHIHIADLLGIELIQVNRPLAADDLDGLQSQVVQMFGARTFRIERIEAGGDGSVGTGIDFVV